VSDFYNITAYRAECVGKKKDETGFYFSGSAALMGHFLQT
jgi:hypothetical protein